MLLCYVWVWVAEWRWRERSRASVLSYDERIDWLESDDCGKWPGRWLHLAFPPPPPFTFFPHSLVFLLVDLFSLYATLCHPPLLSLLGSIMAAHQPSAYPPPTLMARLLALMHFKRTAAATSQSARLSQISTIFILSFVQSRPGSDVLLIMSARLRLSDSGHHHLQPEYGGQLMIMRLIMHCWS